MRENASLIAPVCSILQLSGSMMSLYSNIDLGYVDVSGSVTFSLHYNESHNEFQIHVVQCNDLAAAKKNTSNP